MIACTLFLLRGRYQDPDTGKGVTVVLKPQRHSLIMCIILCATAGVGQQGDSFVNRKNYFGHGGNNTIKYMVQWCGEGAGDRRSRPADKKGMRWGRT